MAPLSRISPAATPIRPLANCPLSSFASIDMAKDMRTSEAAIATMDLDMPSKSAPVPLDTMDIAVRAATILPRPAAIASMAGPRRAGSTVAIFAIAKARITREEAIRMKLVPIPLSATESAVKVAGFILPIMANEADMASIRLSIRPNMTVSCTGSTSFRRTAALAIRYMAPPMAIVASAIWLRTSKLNDFKPSLLTLAPNEARVSMDPISVVKTPAKPERPIAIFFGSTEES